MPGHSNRIVLAGAESTCHRRPAPVAVDFERSGCKLHRNGATKPLYNRTGRHIAAEIGRRRSVMSPGRRFHLSARRTDLPWAESSIARMRRGLSRASWTARCRSDAGCCCSFTSSGAAHAGTSCGRRSSCARPCDATAVDLGLHPREHTPLAPLAPLAAVRRVRLAAYGRPTHRMGTTPVSCPFPLETSP